MSINYYLTLAARIPPAVMLERITPCLPEPVPSPNPYKTSLGLDLYEQRGYYLHLSAPEEDDYAGGSTDEGEWSWELPVATSLSFLFGKDYDGDLAVAENIITVVAQVLATGDEDLSFTFEYDRLYLLRQDGSLTKHFRAQFWDHYPTANRQIPG